MKELPPSELLEKFIIRFERAGHREELKRQAAAAKRSLNKEILFLIEAGQAAIAKQQAEASK